MNEEPPIYEPELAKCCRSDCQTRWIKDIINDADKIFNKIHDIDDIVRNDSQDNLRNFEKISKVRYYASTISLLAKHIQEKTYQLERDLIDWGDSREDKS